MAPTKRKTAFETEASQPEKKRKLRPTTSLLQNEEPSFPRGGGSVLTPLEHKQIQLQATRDVLFEQTRHKTAGDADLAYEGTDGGEHAWSERSHIKGKQRIGSQLKKRKIKSVENETVARVEGLSYKVRFLQRE